MTDDTVGGTNLEEGSGAAGEVAASPFATILFALLEAMPAGKSVSPEAVARAAAGDAWRRALGQVRAEAVGLARQGRVVITRHGRPADPNRFKGVYRLRLPQPGDVIETIAEPACGTNVCEPETGFTRDV